MAERESIGLWSTTAASNSGADPNINFAEGQLPATLNNSNRSVMAAGARFYKDINGSLQTTGSANAYLLTISNTWTAYANGQILSFKASFSNTGAATLNVTNGDGTALGAKALRGTGDVALIANQVIFSGRYWIQYDTFANASAGAWIVLNPSNSAGPPQVFTSSGTYTPTPGMAYCIIECWGGGGGGGGVAGAAGVSGGGGGGGAGGYSRKLATSTDIGASKTVTIGAAGAAGTAGNNNGGAGGTTSVGSLCIANGGTGGTGSAGLNGAGGAGGTAGTGDIAAPGASGFSTNGCSTLDVFGRGGDGASSAVGGGGIAVATVGTQAGSAGTGKGSGGGGAGSYNTTSTAAGGAGTAGYVVVTEYFL